MNIFLQTLIRIFAKKLSPNIKGTHKNVCASVCVCMCVCRIANVVRMLLLIPVLKLTFL